MSATTSPGRRVTPTWVGPGQHCEWRTGQGEVRPLRGAVVTELGDWRVEIDGSTCVDRVQVAAASSEWSSRCRDVDSGCEEGGVHGVTMYGMASRDESVHAKRRVASSGARPQNTSYQRLKTATALCQRSWRHQPSTTTVGNISARKMSTSDAASPRQSELSSPWV
jgi:hypothetical protein